MESSWKEFLELYARAGIRLLRIAKIKENMKAWEDLFFILAGEEGYKKFPGFDDYSCFEKRMRQAFERAWQDHLTKGNFTERGNIDRGQFGHDQPGASPGDAFPGQAWLWEDTCKDPSHPGAVALKALMVFVGS